MRLIDVDALDWGTVEAKHGKRNEAVVDCETLIESAPTIGGWIPVTERLPEEYAQYLVCDEDGDCCVYWLEDAYWARRDIEREHIVAWMPLPEPYKYEEADDE